VAWAPDRADGAGAGSWIPGSAADPAAGPEGALGGGTVAGGTSAGGTALRAPVLAAIDGCESALQVLRRLESSPRGLTEAEAQARLARLGENTLAISSGQRWWGRLGVALRNPFVLILIGLLVISAATGDLGGAAVIAVLAAASCALRVRQEHRSDRAAAALRAIVAATATVVRKAAAGCRPVSREVGVGELVPGDIVELATGDVVPADLVVLRSRHLAISEAVLTGESLPAPKSGFPAAAGPAGGAVCYLGTGVVSGSGTAVVVATGRATYLGSAHRDERRAAETNFDRGVRQVALMLIVLMIVCVPVVLAINAAIRGNVLEAFLFAVAVAVGLTPEMLPVVVTTALARGAGRMAGQSAIIKRLPAIHNIGAMDVLCTDKTGTLTRDQIRVDCAIDPAGSPDPEVLKLAWTNSLHLTLAAGQPVTSLLDLALIERGRQAGLVEDSEDVLDVIAFDYTRRRASVVVRDHSRPAHRIITKGSPAEVLRCCDRIRGAGSAGRDLTCGAAERSAVESRCDDLAATGMRVLAVATATVAPRLGRYTAADEAGLTLVGFIGFRDLPDPSARAALAGLAEAGVTVKVVTGDHPVVAARICRDVGIDPGDPVTGEQIAVLDDASVRSLAGRTTVFARADPAQKARIVQALRADGHTVGFIGDGVNDIAALGAADVGITVAGAVAAARECADVILLRKDLAAVGHAVTEGRRTFVNIAKYLRITVSSNVGNVLSMMLASAVLPFLPMLPLQVLVQNLCSDAAQLALAFDTVDDAALRRPRSFDVRGLIRFAGFLGPVNTLADLATFVILWRLIGAPVGHAGQMMFRAGWFAENLVTQAAAVHLLRTGGWPSLRRLAARPVLLATGGLALAGLCLPLTPIGGALRFAWLPGEYFVLLFVVVIGYCLASTAAKLACLRGQSG
jgi:Mg2+-importing ATPase